MLRSRRKLRTVTSVRRGRVSREPPSTDHNCDSNLHRNRPKSPVRGFFHRYRGRLKGKDQRLNSYLSQRSRKLRVRSLHPTPTPVTVGHRRLDGDRLGPRSRVWSLPPEATRSRSRGEYRYGWRKSRKQGQDEEGCSGCRTRGRRRHLCPRSTLVDPLTLLERENRRVNRGPVCPCT